MSAGLFTERTPPDAPGRRGRPQLLMAVTALVVLAAVGAAFARIESGPHFIAHITFDNPTDYDLSVSVGKSNGDRSTSSLGVVGHHAALTVEQVADQGSAWVFRFTSQGEDGGSLAVPRAQLEGDGWRVAIPARVGDALRAQGAPRPP